MASQRSGPTDGSVAVILAAAGESRRMSGINKIFTPIMGIPLIAHTVNAFEEMKCVGSITLVLSESSLDAGKSLARDMGWSKLTPDRVCKGGARRQDSVRKGLENAEAVGCRWVAVHDGARPCISSDVMERALEAVQETGAAIAAVPAKDTIKTVSPDHFVENTPPRESLWMVQTPQVFDFGLLIEAHDSCPPDVTVTDDAALVERIGGAVKVFMGAYENLKVTTPEDMAVAETFLRASLAQRVVNGPV